MQEPKRKHLLTDEQRKANNNASTQRYKEANREKHLACMREAHRKNGYAAQIKYYYTHKEKRVQEV
jgi:hypothetical protein